MERPALQRLLADIDTGKIDVIVVYKIDRFSRSLQDFMKMIEVFNEMEVSFVSLTQHFSTTDSTGRMFLGILITFAQYEREVIGEPTGEREKWVLALKTTDTTGLTLPNNVIERKVVHIYIFDRESGDVTATVQEKSNLYLRDPLGTLPDSRITVSSITEDHLSFATAEGLNSLLQNLAERTFDQVRSYLVTGFDSFIGSVAVKSVRGEQKTYNISQRRYPVNSTPLKETAQVEAIVEMTANMTRGSVAEAEAFTELLTRLRADESRNLELHASLFQDYPELLLD